MYPYTIPKALFLLVWGGFALIALAVFVLLCYEFLAVLWGTPLVSGYVRAGIAGHPRVALLTAIGVGMLIGHFAWH
jgi:hypothetical protein